MAWTVPMTFTANTVLTASQLNTHLRDNLLETATAKASTSSQIFAAEGMFRIAARTPSVASVGTSETTTSSEWVDLATPGPSVEVETGTRALIWMSCNTQNTSLGGGNNITYELSGDTERDPQYSTALRFDGVDEDDAMSFSMFDMNTTLTPGTNVFTMKYRRGSGTATFSNRQICVWPL
jgi:hypothetical protein